MSSTHLTVVRVIRLGIFGLVSLFSIVLLGMGARLISVFPPVLFDVDPTFFVAFGIGISVATLFSLIPMLVLSCLDKVLWINMVVVEVAWLGVLCVFWLTSAGLTFFIATPIYGETLGFQVLSWLNGVLLFGYTVVLFALSVFQHRRGNRVWTQSVHRVNFFAPGVVYEQKTGQYPPPQQPQQPGQVEYPFGSKYATTASQTPPLANPRYQA